MAGWGRVRDPENDRRFARNREGPTGQGRINDQQTDRRLPQNRHLPPKTYSKPASLLGEGGLGPIQKPSPDNSGGDSARACPTGQTPARTGEKELRS
jgi:hypothetical protein